jgi:hypothetical protein
MVRGLPASTGAKLHETLILLQHGRRGVDVITATHGDKLKRNFSLFFVDALVYTAQATGVKSMHRRPCDALSS